VKTVRKSIYRIRKFPSPFALYVKRSLQNPGICDAIVEFQRLVRDMLFNPIVEEKKRISPFSD